METIVLKFLRDNYDKMVGKINVIEHNFDGLKDYKPGRHVNKAYFYGNKAVRNTELEPNTLRIKV